MSSKSSPAEIISLPKGGGALSGMGEKFSPDLFTGTGNFSVPLALPPGRSNFQPQLNLVYSTGNGNGPFGVGWGLSVPGVSRKTSRGAPCYDDSKDVFLLSGSEDLVPIEALPGEAGATLYRPRTEGLFARIVHRRDAANSYWEVKGADGLVSFYGTPASLVNDPATVADPADRSRIYAWQLTLTKDPFGNRIEYEYERDTGEEGPHHWDQNYLSRIRYIDTADADGERKYLVTVEFVYELRPDAQASYRSGFEIRSRKRCAQILVRTHTSATGSSLIRSYDFIYLDDELPTAEENLSLLEAEVVASPRDAALAKRRDIAGARVRKLENQKPPNGVSLLTSAAVTGHDGSKTQALPPLEFGYSGFHPERTDLIPVTGAELPPLSLAHPDMEMVDLFGSGLPDFVELHDGVRYWRNLGSGRFDPPRTMKNAPAGLALGDAGVQFIDADGDGRTDLLVTKEAISGYFPLSFEGEWSARSFQRYRQAPSFNLEDPEVKLVDLNGDGVTDAIRSGTRLERFFNDPVEGWSSASWLERKNLDLFPNVSFSDPRVKWADLTGDGLQDVVFLHDNSVEYWPNLGHVGRNAWGKRVQMRNAPRLPYGYDPRRLLLGDVDGDGLADLIYIDNTQVTLWVNQCGNRWSEPIVINGTPPVRDTDAVRLADLLGTGISGALWTRDADGQTQDRFFFLDFTGGRKPYLLTEMNNHIGAATLVEYAPSTQFYLDDRRSGLSARWDTTLPFPVQVVSRVEQIDLFSRHKLTTRYLYHDGYWDGAEREFRGFGMVEQRDSETLENYQEAGLHGAAALFARVDPEHFSPPTLTKTWFHQGPVGDEFGDWEERDRSSQYWSGDPHSLSHAETINAFLKAMPPSPERRRIQRDALRALRGGILRTELYALDGTERQDRPYSVSECACGLHEFSPLQAGEPPRLRIFFPHTIAQRTTHWERGTDPISRFSFLRYTDDNNGGEFDLFGRASAQVEIACQRGWKTGDALADGCLATYSRTLHAEPLDPATHIHNRVARSTRFEIQNASGKSVFDLAEIRDASSDLKLFAQSRSFYDGPAFEGLPLGEIGTFGVVSKTESLAFTQEVLKQAYGAATTPVYLAPTGNPVWPSGADAEYPAEFQTLLAHRAGYVFHSGSPDPADPEGYFVNAERNRYDFQTAPLGSNRGLVLETWDPLHDELVDPSAHRTVVQYDDFSLFPQVVTDAAGLTTQAVYDYRLLLPSQVTDANGNRVRLAYTPFGFLDSRFTQGDAPDEGDQARAGIRYEYGLEPVDADSPGSPQPISIRSVQQVHHDTETDVALPERDQTITKIEFSDGFGRLLQTRTQAEDVRFGDAHFGGGETILFRKQSDGDGPATLAGFLDTDEIHPNVVVSGWQIYDNKGRVVEKYEPFFSKGWRYSEPEDSERGQKSATFYDPMGRPCRTLRPDSAETRQVYGVPGAISAPNLTNPDVFEPTPWESYAYDANDNGGRTHPAASAGYSHHWNTPASVSLDAFGRTSETIARTRDAFGNPLAAIRELRTSTTYDIQGNALAITDPLGRVAFQNVYDYLGRTLRADSIDAGPQTSVPDASGALVEHRDAKGALTLYGYDGLNRPIRLWTRDGAGQPLTLHQRAEYGDAGTASQSATDRAASRAANRLGKLHRQYDEAGLATLEDYDFKGNVLQKSRQVASDAALLASFSVPPANWEIEAFRVDWTNVSNGALDPFAYVTTTSYDALNRAKLLTLPQDIEGDRRRLRPRFSRSGGLESVALEQAAGAGGVITSETFVERIAYSARGQRTLIAYGAKILTRYAYDPLTFALARMRTERYSSPPPPPSLTYTRTGDPYQDLAYERDLTDNLLILRERTPGCGVPGTPSGADALNRAFAYDPIYRLVSATGRECDQPPNEPWRGEPRCTDLTKTRAYAERYEYDDAGNLLEMKHLSLASGFTRRFGLMPGSNRLSSLGSGGGGALIGYASDPCGNMTSEATARHFEWDFANRLRTYRTQVAGSEPSVYARYLYDAGGQRVKKLVRKQGGQVEVTIYIDGVFEYQRIVKAGSVQENNTLHIMDDRSRIATVRIGGPFSGDATPAVQYHLSDHLGSGSVTLDATGNAVSREEYTPYGETCFGSFARKRYRFSGKERDEESGLYYYNARYQAPWLARWISCDPIGPNGGLNSYAIFGGNPVNRVDPSGLTDQDPLDKARSEATGPAYTEKSQNPVNPQKDLKLIAEPMTVNGTEIKAPPVTVRSARTTVVADSPSPVEPVKTPISVLRAERLEAAVDGMEDEALDVLSGSFGPGFSTLAEKLVAPLKNTPPKATGDTIRDLEIKESNEGGHIVTGTVVFAVSLLPIAEIAQGARLFKNRVIPGSGFRGASVHDHHIFPQQRREDFAKIGIDVDEHTITIPAKKHYNLHEGGLYNWEWEEFFHGEGANPTKEGAFDFALDLLYEYGLGKSKALAHPYRK